MSWIKKSALWWGFGGAAAMVLVIAGTWQGVHYTSTTEFCLSCHAMRTVGEEYRSSTHFRNASGVRAECKDCHIPPGIVPTLVRKTEALNDLYHTFISPSIDTPEKFAGKRAELAQREWQRMSANNSATCKSCHRYEAMDHAKQSANAAAQMSAAAAKNSNCIDCHKGIAHHKPDMSSGFRERYQQLLRQGEAQADTDTLYTLSENALTAAPGAPVGKALLFPATPVKVLKREKGDFLVEVTGWRESKGRGRVITQFRGKRVFSAVLDATLMDNVKVLQTQIDPESHQQWQQVSVTAWSPATGFINNVDPLWQYADQMLQSTCSACHSTPPPTRYTANGWIAGLKAMSTYYRLNPVEERTLLKYLQTHASDVTTSEKK
ncbi:pentaheme c-type cytochrome TorC [Salmonella enterica subsp. diarizonae]|uniref:Cytochrome c-type protein n=6 Tax=Salmonella enterica TaxID=28901 RepID=A0A2I5HEG4_SALDZ|nr:pentaheme c-type cytochrome TorC [Salmonella enterica]AXC65973.1 pentaheme c-type cytochrome TorC [Salmonella enterica subsp. diarizonae serovar 59:z10:-]EBE3719710.1 pentaheme c-type cytochrome TorC [Salmonella enterica subsp. diarizonae serovar 42:l,v:1,5,7]EBH8035834.1 pentaheme c-type cytochrome TorC [Salmonella bongori]ECH9561497.1 pentaheme c-type cytochrome TorC [Salmonella enterica subsp. salamae]ECI2306230.1 pentaheme c-type cytochrome TorC [Salmonella enterica subsp. enterica sero